MLILYLAKYAARARKHENYLPITSLSSKLGKQFSVIKIYDLPVFGIKSLDVKLQHYFVHQS